ncbi:MAG TPA: calcium/sodium antiporter [Ferrovibrio sp.]|uniref:calcium/sodium antiporter n=1 Tax=Ferrovibrio sp. TaxID=1917215 RepID=UPI002ED0A538
MLTARDSAIQGFAAQGLTVQGLTVPGLTIQGLTAFGLTAAGLAVLVVGAELLVRGGTRLAARLGVSPVVIGLTIVAVGTSTPELAVGIDAVLQGNGDLAVGNIAGTNVVNILLILGLSAAMRPLALRAETLWLDLPMIVGASFALLIMAWDGSLSRAEGILLVGAALAYTAAIVYLARRESRMVRASFAKGIEEVGGGRPHPAPEASVAWNLALLIAGIAVIVVGADWLVRGAVGLARLWAVSDEFIGLTIVAIGTSSPELVTTVVSTLRRQRDIAIGNLLGSSVYNILFILGLTCIVPSAPIPVARSLITVDIPMMAAVALLCVPVFYSGRQVARIEGIAFVAAYLAYLGYLLASRT